MKHKIKLILIAGLILTTSFVLFSNFTLSLFFSDKVWNHKINTIKELESASLKGVELDIVFHKNSNSFDVNHPPEKSQNISLDNYLNNIPTNINYLWLDFKNLTTQNKKAALTHLNSLTKKHQLTHQNIIVESNQLKFLQTFNTNNYKTSYYLPQNLSLKSTKEQTLLLNTIQNNISSYKPTYISSKYIDYDILTEHFSAQKKLFWFNVYGDNNKLKVRFLLYKILLDDNVDALLISS
ncbi:MAG: hypothetical protein P1U44_15130 [Vicingaceae bacterium]|nr:hypothetical protein [Vicingaceae bacterium]